MYNYIILQTFGVHHTKGILSFNEGLLGYHSKYSYESISQIPGTIVELYVTEPKTKINVGDIVIHDKRIISIEKKEDIIEGQEKIVLSTNKFLSTPYMNVSLMMKVIKNLNKNVKKQKENKSTV